VLEDVLVEDIDLPEDSIGIPDPELRLAGMTALHAVFAHRRHACGFQSPLELDQLFGATYAETCVVEVAACRRAIRDQRQHQGRLRQLELGVVGPHLRRFRSEEYPVERDGPLKVGHVQRGVELQQAGVNCVGHDADVMLRFEDRAT
jgi:hypothetical protein